VRKRLRKLRDTARILPWLLITRFASPAEKEPPEDLNDKRLLVIQWNAIGDALMTTPLLSGLRVRFPRARIDVLATDVNRPIFDCRTDVDFVHALRARKPSHIWSLRNELTRARYDVVIDASALVRSACLTRSIGTSSIGFCREIETGFFQVDLTRFYRLTRPYSESRNISELIGSLAEVWDTPVSEKMTFHVPVAAAQRAKDWYGTTQIEANRSIVLHPGAKWPPKRWPETHWIELSRLLLERWTPILVGSESDAAMIRRISASVGPEVKTLVGSDIPTLGAIVQKTRAAICNDSFIMHLAAALGKPVVALFGPVEPRRVVPENAHIEVLKQDVFCSPCELYFSAHRCWRGLNFCLHQIEPHEVLRTLEGLIPDR